MHRVARYPSSARGRGIPQNLMKRILIRPLGAALAIAGCICATPTFADSASDAAQAQALKDAYARGYQAAVAATAHGSAAAADPPAAAHASVASPPPPATVPAPRKPILDIKEVYSDAGDVETVKEEPVTSAPLPAAPTARLPAVAQAPAALAMAPPPVAQVAQAAQAVPANVVSAAPV